MHEIEGWIEDAIQQNKLSIRKLPQEDAIRLQNEVIS
jgi:hypothetical protein